LSRLIERSALAQAARQAGLDQDPVLAEQIEALLIARLRETRWQPHLDALTVTEAEVRAAYEARSGDAFGQPESTRVAVLWFNTRGQAPLVARYRPRLEEIRRQILADPAAFPVASGFGELAAGNTEHAASRLKGGDLGWLDSGPSTDPWRVAVLETAASLQQPGDLSEVTANASGLFLVRVIERRAARVQSFDEARPRLERSLLEQRRSEAGQQLMSDIVAAASVQRFDERLSALAPLPPPAAPQPVPAFPNP
jgi:parvulin-like peptidyl-prolyl isomerase